MGRPPGARSGRPTKAELTAAIDTAERRLMLMVGRAINGIPGGVRDEIGDITDPLRVILRRMGLRNGPVSPVDRDKS